MNNHWNNNGLVDGKIPAGQGCPWANQCSHKTGNCPTEEDRKPVAFSCALARLRSLIKHKGYDDNAK